MSRPTLAAVLAAVLCAGGTAFLPGPAAHAAAPAAAPADATAMSWTLSQDMAADPIDNPIADSYGNPGVWAFYGGSGDDDSTYTPLYSTTTNNCGASGFVVHRVLGGGDAPLIGYNGSGGDVSCGTPYVPADSVDAHPAPDSDVIVAWTSPINGTIAFSGFVKDNDAGGGNGVTYSVATAGTDLISGTMDNGGVTTFQTAQSYSVTKGQTLYLHIGARDGDYRYDSTRVDITFTDTTPPTPPTLSSSSPKKVKQGRTATVTLHGSGFDANTQVSLDDASDITLASPQVVDSHTLTVGVTPGADATPGTVRHWQVSSGGSTTAGCAKCTLTVVAVPVATSTNPSGVAAGSSYTLSVSGSGFAPGMTAAFSGTGITVTDVSVTDADDALISIDVDSAAKPGARNLKLTDPGQGSSTAKKFLTVMPPV